MRKRAAGRRLRIALNRAREKQQATYADSGAEQEQESRQTPFARCIAALKAYYCCATHRQKGAQQSHDSERIFNERRLVSATVGLRNFTAALVVVAIVGAVVSAAQWWEIHSSSIDTKQLAKAAETQADAAIKQAVLMRGQLDEMREEQRPWIGIDQIQNDTTVEAGKPFKISVFTKNFGRGPAPQVKACIGSGTVDPKLSDEAGLAKITSALAGCPDPSQISLLPNGEFDYDVSRKPEMVTASLVADIKSGAQTFATFGRIDYVDSHGTTYWTTFCALYIPDIGKFNACHYGNEAH